ncbi:MAG TPA: nitrogenase component 1 [Polyangiaceae bacterium]|nr:nitrogenase component 1 [Polyangiaceae bacterium]
MGVPILPKLAESPRYTCSLGGGIATAAAIHRVVPIIHAGPGCGMQLFNGLQYVAGYQWATYVGSSATPSTNTSERDVVFGGEPRLRQTIQSTLELMDADLYVVLTGCTSEIIGDDVQSVVNEFRQSGAPIVHAATSGFKGLTRRGYELVLESLIDSVVKPAERDSMLVNLFGVVPGADVFWQGSLEEIARLLGELGVRVNTFFTNRQGVESVRTSSAAALNIVLSPDGCDGIVSRYSQQHSIPYLRFDGPPVGPTATTAFLRQIGTALEIREAHFSQVASRNEETVYDYFERASLAFTGFGYQHRVAVLGDASSVVSLTRFLVDDFGQIPAIAVVTEPLSDEGKQRTSCALERSESVKGPSILFSDDQREAWKAVAESEPSFILGSSLDKDIAEELGALHLSVSFPVTDRVILSHSYVGYRGAITLAEDLFAPALTQL